VQCLSRDLNRSPKHRTIAKQSKSDRRNRTPTQIQDLKIQKHQAIFDLLQKANFQLKQRKNTFTEILKYNIKANLKKNQNNDQKKSKND